MSGDGKRSDCLGLKPPRPSSPSGSPTSFTASPRRRRKPDAFMHGCAQRLRLATQLLRTNPAVDGVCRPKADYSASRPITSVSSFQERARSQGPSLHRHYPTSAVLWPCPTPAAAAAQSRRRGRYPRRDGSPPLPGSPSRRAVPTTPADRTGAPVDCFPIRAAFPDARAGRHPRLHFRGLLRLHSRYGPSSCSATQGGLCHEASTRPVTRPSRSSATRPIDNYLGGSYLHWSSVPFRGTPCILGFSNRREADSSCLWRRSTA
jgi:hypothetical protein